MIVHGKVGIAAQFAGNNGIGFRIQTIEPEVQIVPVIQNPDDRLFRSWSSLKRLSLAELRDARPGCPALIDYAVKPRRVLRSYRPDIARRRLAASSDGPEKRAAEDA